MSNPATKPPARYVTVSLRPETHRHLLAILRPRETMDELIKRLISSHPADTEPRHIHQEGKS